MHKMRLRPVLAGVGMIAVGVALAAPASAWSWPWEKTSSSEPSQTAAPAASTAAAPKHTATKKIVGTLESVDAAKRRLDLKTSAGKSESFTLSSSATILVHDRAAQLSTLKAGERVVVHYHPDGNEAIRISVLGGKKA